jgi:hypothetical protein
VNLIQSHGQNHHQLQFFLSEIYVEYGDILYHTEFQLLSCGAALKWFLALRLEIEMFVNENGKFVAELNDQKWLWYLGLVCYIHSFIY